MMPERTPSILHVASRRFTTSWLLVAMSLGCIEVTDLRSTAADPDIHSGQIDTGFVPDTPGPELPETIACSSDGDCVAWANGLPCITPSCTAGECRGDPVEDGRACSDGDPATQGDQCRSGVCDAGPTVCICDSDAACAPFDDGDGCNGRLRCDGCACVPEATPPGTPCDDGDVSTIDDRCEDGGACIGTRPCLCSASGDCSKNVCEVAVCADCECRVFDDAPGTLYAEVAPDGAVPEGWIATSTSTQVYWRAGPSPGLRATGPGGTYDHGAVDARLTSSRIVAPAGPALVELVIGLPSTATGCDDRLEVRIGGALVDTLCAGAATGLRAYPIAGEQDATLELRFIADDSDNAGAGATLTAARWIRVAPPACGNGDTEVAVPAGPGQLETAPDIAAFGLAYQVIWQDDDGVSTRTIDSTGTPTGPVTLVAAGGRRPAVGAGLLAWETDAGVSLVALSALLTGGASVVTVPNVTAPDIDGTTPRIAVWDGSEGRLLDETGTNLFTAPSLWAPRAAEWKSAGALVVTSVDGVRLVASDDVIELPGDAPTGRPDAAAGASRVGVVWPTAAGLSIATTNGESAALPKPGATAPAIAYSIQGWVVAWIVPPGGAVAPPNGDEPLSGDLSAVLFTGTLGLQVPYPAVATFGPGASAAPRVAATPGGVMAVWVAPWLDGDAQTVVVRELESPLQ
ncbi:MAG: hypothetical protein IV100_10295 [Myxococcales bacterium]|nr:hypothetical protein [Myxococcales bacterium]